MGTPSNVTPTSSSFKFDITSFLPEGHEKAFKQAFYNVAAGVFVLFISVALIAVYYVLEPFLRPLLWAVLFGSVLHPFKHRMTVVLKNWLQKLQNSDTPLTVGAVTSPFLIIDHVSEQMLEFIMHYAIVFVSIFASILGGFLVYNCVPDFITKLLLEILSRSLSGVSSLLEFCHGATVFVWTVVVGYLVILSVWWTPNTRPYLICLSPFVWTVLICHLVSIAGSLRVTILLVFFVLMLIGFLADLKGRYSEAACTKEFYSVVSLDQSDDYPYPLTPIQAIRSGLAWIRGTDNISSELSPDLDLETPQIHQNVQVDPKTPEKTNRPTLLPTNIFEESSEEKMSNFYLYWLMWSCLLAEVWLHMWLFYLLLIPFLYMGLKHAVMKFGVLGFIKEKLEYAWNTWNSTFEQRKDALIPAPLRGLWRLLLLGDRKFLTLLEVSIDTFTSLMTIGVVFLLFFFGTVFLSVQVYGESMHLVTVTSSLINRTVHNTDIQQLVPESLRDVQGTLDSMLDDAFLYGRGWISASVRRIIDDKNEERAAALEKQILEIFDRVYELWHSRNDNSTSPNLQHVASFDSLLNGFKTLNMDLIVNFVKENIGTLLAVLDSVWTILKGNISLAFSTITAILSLLFGGGTAVLNFVLNFVVFCTSLFYLLCASGTHYKPVEVCSNLMPSAGSGSQFGKAVEQSINGVFAASFKMAAFYGLYTWLIHTLFSVKIIYIPSVLAAIFGAVPFLGAYWACLPAVLELWLVNGQIAKAGIMLAVQLLPTSFVDSAIYSEIKGGGHPYITGLAIAGGVFCLGFEGALFGPMLLCVLFVAMHMYGAVINPTSMNEKRRYNKAFSLKRTNSE